MKFIAPTTTEALLSEAENEKLYQKMIEQLNKDFSLANESIDIPEQTSAENLKAILHEKVYRLIQHNFAEYLNLLYIIDVSEEEVKKLDGSDIAVLSGQVAFLILKREWQKVWFKNRF